MRRVLAIVGALSLVACGPDERPIPEPVRGYVDVSVRHDGDRVCAVTTAGAIRCWGKALDYGEVEPPRGDFVRVVVGGWLNCADELGGSVRCWGAVDDSVRRLEGYRDFALTDIAQVCGVVSSGVECPFPDSFYEDPSWPDLIDSMHERAVKLQERAPSGDFIDVSASSWDSCAVRRDGCIICWGHVFDVFPGRYEPPDGRFTQVAVGNNFACALREDGTATCWANLTPEFGDTRYTEISAGFNQVCAIRAVDQHVECYGDTLWGQDEVPDLPFKVISAGQTICGVTIDDEVVCWGNDEFGQTTVPMP